MDPATPVEAVVEADLSIIPICSDHLCNKHGDSPVSNTIYIYDTRLKIVFLLLFSLDSMDYERMIYPSGVRPCLIATSYQIAYCSPQ